MAGEDGKLAAHRALVDSVLHAEGRSSREDRARAFDNVDVPPAVRELIGKVATTPTAVTDADYAGAKAAGFSEDQLFELVVCAAVGQSARQYEAGLAALAEATGEEATHEA